MKRIQENCITTLLVILFFVIGSTATSMAEEASRYRGRWNSFSTGHSGPMRATLRPRADGSYQATFAGRFALVIPFVYRATLVPSADGGFTTSKKLGPFLGEYRMDSTISQQLFLSNFQAAGDYGSFTLYRTK